MSTSDDYALLILRVVLGIVFFIHGAQKTFGWFGGFGFAPSWRYFTGTLGIPAPIAILVFPAEFLGGPALVVGLLGRVAALGIAISMVVATVLVHLPYGFFMNWYGRQKGEGYEYHLLAIAMALAIVLRGSGALSLDRWLTRR